MMMHLFCALLASTAPEQEATAANVDIDISGLGSAYARLPTLVEARVRPVIAAGGQELSDVRIELYWEDEYAFVLDIRAKVTEGDIEAVAEDVCTKCTDEAVANRTVSAVSKAMLELQHKAQEAKEEPDPEPEPKAAVKEEQPSPVPAETSDTGRRGLGTLGWSGVGVLSGGALALVTGGVLAGLGERETDTNEIAKVSYRDYQTPGFITLGVGGAAVITGAVLIILDRRRARSRRTALVPSAGPAHAGLTLRGRF